MTNAKLDAELATLGRQVAIVWENDRNGPIWRALEARMTALWHRRWPHG